MSQEEENKTTDSATTQEQQTENQTANTENKTAGDDFQLKYAELNDKYLRLYSEFDNYRKRTTKERAELLKTASEDVIKSLLPALDDLERAIRNNSNATDVAAVNEGVQLVFQKLHGILVRQGLEAMDSQGKAFDVELHEAITNIPAPSEDMKGKVVDEVEKGYLLNGKVIRFAKVVVGA